VVLGWIGWPEEKGFKDLEGMEERFTILVRIKNTYTIPFKLLFKLACTIPLKHYFFINIFFLILSDCFLMM